MPIWYFLYELLQLDTRSELMEWISKESLIFRFKNPHEVAHLWGLLKGSHKMTYASFARSIRYHYGKETIEKVSIAHLTKSIFTELRGVVSIRNDRGSRFG